MAEESTRQHNEPERPKVAPQHAGPVAGQEAGLAEAAEARSYPSSLLGDPRLGGRGNGSVRTAILRQAQQTYGNRQLQRALRRATPSAGRGTAPHADPLGHQPSTQGSSPPLPLPFL